jgi:uncharacterized coiled-coil protein SlyX
MDDLRQITERIAQAEERVARQSELLAELERAGRLVEARQVREQLANITESLRILRGRLEELRRETNRLPEPPSRH